MDTKGKFVVIEGIDGAGKSTQVAALKTYLESEGIDVINIREPGSTPISESIRRILKDPDIGLEVFSHKAELLLFFAAREQVIQNVIRPALEVGKWVIADRFYLSSLAYQGHGLGLVKETEALVEMVVGDLVPDLQIVLDVGYTEVIGRLEHRGEADRIEQRGEAFFKKVSDAFIHYAQMSRHNAKILPAYLPAEEISKYIQTIVKRELL